MLGPMLASAGPLAAPAAAQTAKAGPSRRPPGEPVGATSASKLAALVRYIVQIGGDAELVAGWEARIEVRKAGNTAGIADAYWFSPTGKRFRSKVEVARHFELASAPPPKEKKAKVAAVVGDG